MGSHLRQNDAVATISYPTSIQISEIRVPVFDIKVWKLPIRIHGKNYKIRFSIFVER